MQNSYFELILYPNTQPEVFSQMVGEFLAQIYMSDSKNLDDMVDSCAQDCDFSSYPCEFVDSQSVFDYAIPKEKWRIIGNPNLQEIESRQKTKIIFAIPETTAQGQKTSDILNTIESHLKQTCEILSARLQEQIGLAYALQEKKNKDWLQTYKDSITPIDCGKFHITPSWHFNAESSKGRIPIIIDPALAFGSGHHASTALCLELLSTLELEGKNVLDVGCGSGILSIASAKLGANVLACDTDSLSIEQTELNMQKNNTTCTLIHGSLNKIPAQPQDVIIANITALVLKSLYKDFLLHLPKNGILIISGILAEYKNDIIACFNRGFAILQTLERDEWVAFKMQKL
ncbi:50S ribosomal protein L11 methyltransferase [Helicobacter sp. MIT 00-7814]|uniref:50S ribosomal protein L11 methyltransferase n=1 Tax=unclassified Helicobacter TaxID=2593540 RepID=UPI000E1F8BE9|nr:MULTISPECIES: 50S ribosomal protein L11 methyltransferase [unclassified Helicobacter]RDU52847.1 50S ribosomal protein L11 methyltransferase [Helicobacter sp. MIT 00-7814]RDU56003.1 50S ribosomal protein L11 methyltransferase [Helicobacter sp. MIT 99-10781]